MISTSRSGLVLPLLFSTFFFTSIRYASFISIAETLVIAMFLYLAIKEFQRLKTILIPIFLSFVIALLFIALTNDQAIQPFQSSINVIRIFLHYSILFCVISLAVRNIRDVRLALYCFIGAAALSVTLQGLPWFSQFIKYSGQRSGFFNYTPVMAGILLSLALTLAIYFIAEPSRKNKWFILLVPILISGIERTQTVSALVLICINYTCFFLGTLLQRSMSRNLSYLILLFFNVFFLVTTLNSTVNRFKSILDPLSGLTSKTSGRESTIESRIASIKYSIELATSKPLTGFGFDFQSQKVPYLSYQPHNYIVMSFQSGGIFSLLLALLFFITCLTTLVRALRRNDFVTFSLVFIPISAMLTNPLISTPTLLAPIFLGFVTQKRFGRLKNI